MVLISPRFQGKSSHCVFRCYDGYHLNVYLVQGTQCLLVYSVHMMELGVSRDHSCICRMRSVPHPGTGSRGSMPGHGIPGGGDGQSAPSVLVPSMNMKKHGFPRGHKLGLRLWALTHSKCPQSEDKAPHTGPTALSGYTDLRLGGCSPFFCIHQMLLKWAEPSAVRLAPASLDMEDVIQTLRTLKSAI